MQLVPILPDEWLSGYVGRIAAMNNCFNQPQLAQKMRSHFGDHERYRVAKTSFLALVAEALGLNLSSLVYDHTLFRLLNAFPVDAPVNTDPGEPFSAKQGPFVTKGYRSQLWFCPKCVVDDRDRRLFSYWRRSHQIPGVFTCFKHKTALAGIAHKGLLNFTPDVCDNSSVLSDQTISKIISNSWIQSTIQILQLILESDNTISQSEVIRRLRTESGFESSPSKHDFFAAISSDLTNNLSAEWLRDYMPRNQLKGDRVGALMPLFASRTNFKISSKATNIALLAARYWPVDSAIKKLIVSSSVSED